MALFQPHHGQRVLVSRLHWLYIDYVVRCDCLSPSRNGSTSTTPCVATTHLLAIAALHQLRRAPQLLISFHSSSTSIVSCTTTTHCLVAPALLRLCHASGRTISSLDFSSVGSTSSHRASGHCVLRLDNSSPGCNGPTAPILCIPDTLSCASTTRLTATPALP
jgi:hypothetical protein